jgi:hypothetical protein
MSSLAVLFLLGLPCASLAIGLPTEDRSSRVRDAVQPILESVAHKYNMSFSFGFADASGRVGLAAGKDNIWRNTKLKADTPIPLGSVTKPWTAVLIMQAVERGKLSLDDKASAWIDPVLGRLWRTSMRKLWKDQRVEDVRIKDLMGMTSGFYDYDDFFLEHISLQHTADDIGPLEYIVSSAKQGFACNPGTCAMYAGSNYVLLGLVLVQVNEVFAWQDVNQLGAISSILWKKDHYKNTSFLKLGRCVQTPGVARQHAWAYWKEANETQEYIDLGYSSCLNGWTMGNIVSTGKDLATFFYDLFTVTPEEGGFLNATSLQLMQKYKTLNDTWCEGPTGPGSCTYGMGLLSDQVGQDIWASTDANADPAEIAITGHPGEDWGSGCSPCGYNQKYKFGICMAYTSVVGQNCSGDYRMNNDAVQEATCLAYDAVLSIVGAPRLDCAVTPPSEDPKHIRKCTWEKRYRNHTNSTRRWKPWYPAQLRQRFARPREQDAIHI